MMETQPNLISDSKLDRSVNTIVVGLRDRLSLLQS